MSIYKQQHELESTKISKPTAIVMSCVFVLVLLSVPVSQILFDPSTKENILAANADVLDSVYYRHVEETLERSSSLVNTIQPKIQEHLTRFGKFGNDQVTRGRNDWLFYQPGLRYVYGPDLATQNASQALDTIVQFHEDCKRLGIHLIVAPIPDKATMQPWALSSRFDQYDSLEPLNNKGYAEFRKRLARAGVDVFDAVPSEITKSEIHYLFNDTHWTPGYMKSTAAKLAEHIFTGKHISTTRRNATLQLYNRTVQMEGDLTRMLQLDDAQALYKSQQVRIERVQNRWSGDKIKSDFHADVMLLGDSFTNIYSSPDLGWGEGGGFAEHLSYELNRPVDVLAINGGAAYSVRKDLVLPENLERLARKKIVVYQFAMRELMDGDWRPIPLPEALPAVDATSPPEQARRFESTQVDDTAPPPPLRLIARVRKTSIVPRPFTAPYANCVTYITLDVEKVIEGKYDDPELLGVFFAMEKNKWLPPASYKAGDRILATWVPNKNKPGRFRNMQAADDTEDYTHSPFFALDSRILSPGEVIETLSPAPISKPQNVASTGSPEDRSDTSIEQRSPEVATARARSIQETKDSILQELNDFGDGDWLEWHNKLMIFRANLAAKITPLTPNNPNAEGRDEARSTVLQNNGRPLLFEIKPEYYLRYLYAVPSIDDWDGSRKVVSLLTKISEWYALHGIDLIVVPVPRMTEVYPDTITKQTPDNLRVAPHMRRFIYELLENDVEVIDLLPVFLDHRKFENPPLYFPIDPHWSQTGSILAVQEIRNRLTRYDVIQKSLQRAPQFNTFLYERLFEGAGLGALNSQQFESVLPSLKETVVFVQGTEFPLKRGAWIFEDSPVLVTGDSSVHYPRPQETTTGTNMVSALAVALNRPLTDYSKGGQKLNDPLAQFLREPTLLEGRKVAILVLSNATLARDDLDNLPPPIEGELNRARN